MAPRVEHPLHQRRRGRNVGLGLVLAAFAALVFGLSVVKIRNGDMMEAFDHQPRTSALPLDPQAPARTAPVTDAPLADAPLADTPVPADAPANGTTAP